MDERKKGDGNEKEKGKKGKARVRKKGTVALLFAWIELNGLIEREQREDVLILYRAPT